MQNACALLLPACGEKVGMRGHYRLAELTATPTHPDCCAIRPLPAQRGEENNLVLAARLRASCGMTKVKTRHCEERSDEAIQRRLRIVLR